MAAGGGMEAGGLALDGTGVLAPAGVMVNAGGLVLVGDGLINAKRSSKSLAKDLFSFASNGGNKGVTDAERTMMREANEVGAEIISIGATRDMYPACQAVASENGIVDRVATPLKKVKK